MVVVVTIAIKVSSTIERSVVVIEEVGLVRVEGVIRRKTRRVGEVVVSRKLVNLSKVLVMEAVMREGSKICEIRIAVLLHEEVTSSDEIVRNKVVGEIIIGKIIVK